MKKFFFVSTSFLALALILTGCSSQSASKTNNQAGRVNPDQFRQPDFGQPNRTPDIRGVVKSMVGNEVTVLKIDLPSGGRASSTDARAENASGAGSTSSETRNVAAFVGAAGGTGARGEIRMMGGGPGEQTGETRAQMLAQLKAMSTGEETIVIPVGIQMLKVDTSDNKRTMVEATLADITADKNITVWLNIPEVQTDSTASGTESGMARKIAEFVLIN